jgi:arabinose-5-phosphate isomerase
MRLVRLSWHLRRQLQPRLVMGDAIAVALMEARQFQHEDFARFHPGGSLGRKLLVKVKDLMRTDNLPFIIPKASFTELLLCMSEGRLGMVIVGSMPTYKRDSYRW